MPVTARFETTRASRYLQQLCKHFAHKVPATWNETHGEVGLPYGRCILDADDAALTMTCEATEPEREPMLVKVVEVHLERFAFRESVALEWRRDGEPAAALMAALRAMPDPHGERGHAHDGA